MIYKSLPIYVLVLTVMLFISFDANAVRLEEKYRFGTKKGEKIGTSEDVLRENLIKQVSLLNNLVEEQKKANELLKKQVDLLDGSSNDTQDIMIAVIKELAKSTKEQNRLLKELVNKR